MRLLLESGGWPTLSFASKLKLGLPHTGDFCKGGNNCLQLIRENDL
ncbi:hypothetical protein SBA7_270017 [Candidatus Sulfotelmatobacter sp. SbA7]|nr:hypothetical protein SBA7_270017 [Candidatus Sulfotelmatobacter sp. SbA7]